jgi:hypothetical protein
MQPCQLSDLPQIFQSLTDPRDPRGIRHPYSALCALVFLGLLAKITEMAVLVRWTKAHWDELHDALGFTRSYPPSATCISRSLAKLSLAEFRQAFSAWIQPALPKDSSFLVAAVDGKSCKQGLDENGDPELLLNVFLQDFKLALTQWPVGNDKTNEPTCLKNHVKELLLQFPLLNLLTGDAIYLQRPLLEVLQQHGCDYLFQVKANQPETMEALDVCFEDSRIGSPYAESIDKKGALKRFGESGVTVMMPIGCGNR